MAGVIHHPLVESADQIVNRALPRNRRENLQRRLYSYILYIKRVEKKHLTPLEKEYLAHGQLGLRTKAPSKELANALRDRIRIIDEYRIQSINRIHEMLEYGFEITSSKTLTKNQLLILKELVKDPMMNVSQLSKQINKSRQYVSKALKQLEDEFVLKRSYQPNRGKLKLTSFSVFFRTKSYNHSKALESWLLKSDLLFQSAFVFDVTFRNGFIGFAIPSQHRAFRLFESRIRQLEHDFFERAHLQQATELFWNIRFDYYDHEQGKWLIPSELKRPRDFSKLKQPNADGLSYCSYADLRESAIFDRIDLLITKMQMSPHDTIADLQSFLSQYNVSLSHNALWLRLNRLKQQKIIFPDLYFSGAGFEEFVSLSIFCSSQTQKQLQVMASFFPLSYTYLTDQGIIIFIKRPSGWKAFLTKLIQELPSVFTIDDLMVVHQERNYGSGLKDQVYNRWNEKQQYWKFTEEEI